MADNKHLPGCTCAKCKKPLRKNAKGKNGKTGRTGKKRAKIAKPADGSIFGPNPYQPTARDQKLAPLTGVGGTPWNSLPPIPAWPKNAEYVCPNCGQCFRDRRSLARHWWELCVPNSNPQALRYRANLYDLCKNKAQHQNTTGARAREAKKRALAGTNKAGKKGDKGANNDNNNDEDDEEEEEEEEEIDQDPVIDEGPPGAGPGNGKDDDDDGTGGGMGNMVDTSHSIFIG